MIDNERLTDERLFSPSYGGQFVGGGAVMGQQVTKDTHILGNFDWRQNGALEIDHVRKVDDLGSKEGRGIRGLVNEGLGHREG